MPVELVAPMTLVRMWEGDLRARLLRPGARLRDEAVQAAPEALEAGAQSRGGVGRRPPGRAAHPLADLDEAWVEPTGRDITRCVTPGPSDPLAP